MKAILWIKVHMELKKKSNMAQLDIRLIPLLQRHADNIFMVMPDTFSNSDTEYQEHQERLNNTLTSWQMKRKFVDGDGDCLFHSVAFSLRQLAEFGNAHAINLVQRYTTGCNTAAEAEDQFIKQLRQAMVYEWTGPNSAEYQSFLTSEEIITEAPRFLERGNYCGEMGDLVVTALANALRIPIVLFTSAANFPLTTIMPSYATAATEEPIYLALTQYGGGHYDAVMHSYSIDQLEEEVDITAPSTPLQPLKPLSCTCGRNKGGTSKACISGKQYATRCPCYKAAKPCNTTCKCKDCQNEYGKATKPAAKRRRIKYAHQEHDLKGKKVQFFMEEVGETPRVGPWTDFEVVVMAAILEKFTGSDEVDVEMAISETQAAKDIADTIGIGILMPKRSPSEIKKLINYSMHTLKDFSKVLL